MTMVDFGLIPHLITWQNELRVSVGCNRRPCNQKHRYVTRSLSPQLDNSGRLYDSAATLFLGPSPLPLFLVIVQSNVGHRLQDRHHHPDVSSERAVTLITVAHRLQTIIDADKVTQAASSNLTSPASYSKKRMVGSARWSMRAATRTSSTRWANQAGTTHAAE
ncbi:hypothetical protein BJV74DRAFT_102341 [Russula compacta]|nr:hypothetical protein BJV74DRAFT_102341 [Russula compacta]